MKVKGGKIYMITEDGKVFVWEKSTWIELKKSGDAGPAPHFIVTEDGVGGRMK